MSTPLFNLSSIFETYLTGLTPEQRRSLQPHQDDLMKQALFNQGLKACVAYDAKEKEMLLAELGRLVHLDGHLSSLIGDDDEALVSPHGAGDEHAKDVIHAKNLFKHLTRGTPLSDPPGLPYLKSFLAHEDVLNTFFKERDPRLMKVFREQMQGVFLLAFEKLKDNAFTEEETRQYELFQTNLMSSYPFWDPCLGEEVKIPQKINGTWILVPYQFTKLDISPKTGPLSWVMTDEERMYAYALEPKENLKADAHLLLMGTTYPAGQGAGLAGLYNFSPGLSVGEGHDVSEVSAWLATQADGHVKVTGHSKGAVMAMLVAATHPRKIKQADCLNPTGLAETTLRRLSPGWEALSDAKRPTIHVYAQKGDPVYPLEGGFLKGTQIYRVIPEEALPAMNVAGPFSLPIPACLQKAYEAHVHIFSGRKKVLLLKVNAEQENQSHQRALFNDIKYVLNWLRFPLEYTKLFSKLVTQTIEKNYENEKKFVSKIMKDTMVDLADGKAPDEQRSDEVLDAVVASLTSVPAYFVLKVISCLVNFVLQAMLSALSIIAHLSALVLGASLFAVKRGLVAGSSFFAPAPKAVDCGVASSIIPPSDLKA